MLAKLNFASHNGRKDNPNDFRLNIVISNIKLMDIDKYAGKDRVRERDRKWHAPPLLG
jgi:hypothetical protein